MDHVEGGLVQASYRFGRAELLPEARQLVIDGQPASLGGRAFDMLQVLIERRGRLVKKAELLDLVWPGLVVEENNLQVHMSHLRKLLGAQTIATIPGRGYRFDATVEASSSAPAALVRAEPHEIPAPATRLLGRDADLAIVARMCAEHQLVTILGAGGIGKTRVAQAMARQSAHLFPDGIVWVDLAVLADSALVPAALATALGITLVPKVDPFEAMLAHVGERALLIVIDNAEHLADAVCRALRRLLAAGPAVRVLVTSQQPLRISLENIYRLGPLAIPSLPSSVAAAEQYSAVALLCERVVAIDMRFRLTADNVDDVVRICQRLDGMPLAIELAAARLPLLGAAGLLAHLDARFQVLISGDRNLPTRQQTLRATLEWSHALLSENEKRVLRRVAVSVGGFDLDLARKVASDGGEDDWVMLDALGGLVERSWVNVDAAPVPRYSLPETGRTYALLTLHEAGEFNAIRRRHGETVGRLFDQAFADFWTVGDDAYLARYVPELDNFRAAMGWAREGDPAIYVSMASAAIPLLRHLSLIREGFEYLAVASSLVEPTMPLAIQARLAASTAMLGGGRAAAERAVELYRRLDDPLGLFVAIYWLTGSDVSAGTLEELVAEKRRIENPAWPLKVQALGRAIEEELLYRDRKYTQALRSADLRIEMCESAGAADAATSAQMSKVIATFGAGDLAGAVEQALRVVERCRRLNNNYRLACVESYAFTALLLLDPDRRAEAERIARSFSTLDRTLGWPHCRDAVDGLALLAALDGRTEEAVLLIGFADAVHRNGAVTRDALAAAARERVVQLVQGAVAPDRRVALEEEGKSLTPDDAARLALRHWPGPASG